MRWNYKLCSHASFISNLVQSNLPALSRLIKQIISHTVDYWCDLIGLWNCSMSFCPYSVKVKELLQQLGAMFFAIELDKEKRRTNLHRDGKLVPMLTEAGAISAKAVTNSA
ncbi:hypothetical protein Bca4012_064961 [Brassica carinata]